MKHFLFLMVVLSLVMQGIDQNTAMNVKKIRKDREWNAQEYAQGNKFREMVALTCIQESGINLVDKTVLDIGCGMGNITAIIADCAKTVHGIDASKNMIEYALQAYSAHNNLSFEHCFAQDYSGHNTFDRVVSFSCLHWIKDKQSVIERVNNALSMQGEFFGTCSSLSDAELLHLIVFKKIFPQCIAIHPYVKEADLIHMADFHLISDEEFKNLLERNGFEIIMYEQKSFGMIVSKESFENALWPLVMSRPFMQSVPEEIKQSFFDLLIDECLKLLSRDEEDNYIIPASMLTTKVFHVRKVKES